LQKGEGRKTILIGIFAIVIFPVIFLLSGMNFQIKETYIFLGMLSIPGIVILICGLIFIKREKKEKSLVAKVNKDFIEIISKKGNIKIELNKIDRVKSYTTQLNIFYDVEGKKQKHLCTVSAANRGLIELALKEYKKDIIIDKVYNYNRLYTGHNSKGVNENSKK